MVKQPAHVKRASLAGIVFMVVVSCLATTAKAYDYRYALGFRVGMVTLFGGDPPRFTIRESWGGELSYRFHEQWLVTLSVSAYTLYNDTASSGRTFFSGKDNATQAWKAACVGAVVNRRVFSLMNRMDASLGLGGGLMIWKFVDPAADTTLQTRGVLNNTVDYAASELFLTATGNVNLPLSERLALQWGVSVDYMTAAGAEFQAGINSSRPRWLVGSTVALRFGFGPKVRTDRWQSEASWGTTPLSGKNSSDEAKESIHGTVTDGPVRRHRKPTGGGANALDSDGDGVIDERDDCPRTDPRARGLVDVFGCPLDSDFDGIPDYLDACPHNPVGALVDTSGCPIDSDADGVPDGLDDCPHTLFGVAVDSRGCIDLSILSKPLVLHIDYAPGSYEVDPANRQRLKELARILNFVPEIKLDIYGYTDNIGKERANRQLSEKRARRVRDHLVALGVAAERIRVFGRGETNFIAPNDTAEGRAKNRRVEIVFYR
jgi:hypothetical protein